jgi:hypothetical protein
MYLSDELAQACSNSWSSRLKASTLPTPIKAKALPLPAYNSIGMQRVQHLPPPVDIFREQNPKKAVDRRYPRTLYRWLEHCELLAERQILQCQLTA